MSKRNSGFSIDRLKKIRPWMQHYVDTGKLAGALTLVARHGEIVCLESCGQRDMENNLPVTEDTIFRIYSMTKPITSVAIMMLYEDGHFQLNDPICEFIPEFKNMRVYNGGEGDAIRTEAAERDITIHHLLTHTSGLTYGLLNNTPVAKLYVEQQTDFNHRIDDLETVVNRLAGIALEFEPGTRWNYGVSTDVLGRIVEIVSGKSLDQFIQEKITEPLGMHDTGFSLRGENTDRLAALHEFTQDNALNLLESPQKSSFVSQVTTYSGGAGLVSTVNDYFRFTEMLRRKGEFDGARLLGRKTVEYMVSNHLPGDLADMGQATFNETSYAGIGFGLGFAVVLEPTKSRVLCSKDEYGWGGAASTVFWIDPREDISVIFLTQLLPSSKYPLRPELRTLVNQALID
ncbi:MAG: beta-lactamase family protein [Gammaproteobacteria bacterium]|nr:beta-lactamase family protein [Gammaproteobacteria bacterium]